MSSVIVEGVETMLLGLASGVLTGVACLAAWKGPRRRASGGGMLDPSHDLHTEPSEDCTEAGPRMARDRESSLAGAMPVFPAGPLEQAGDFIQKIRSARAAAATSVAEFKHLLETQQLTDDASAEEMLQQQLSLLEADLMSAEVTPKGRTLGSLHTQEPTREGGIGIGGELAAAVHTEAAVDEAPDDGVKASAEPMLQQQLADARAEVAAMGADLLHSRAQLATATEELGRVHGLQTDVQNNVQGVQACIGQLTQQLEAAQQVHVAALQHGEGLEQHMQGLEQQLQQAQQQADAYKQQLQQAQAEVQQTHRQLEQLQAESHLKDQQLEQAHQAHKQELQEVAQLSHQHQQRLQQEVELQREQLLLSQQQLQGELELQKQQRQQAQEQAQQAAQHLQQLQQECQLQKEQLRLSQQQVQQLQSGLELQKQQQKEAQEQQQQAQQRLQQDTKLQKEQLLTTQQQLQQLQGKLEQQKQQRQQAQEQAQQAEQQRQHLQQECGLQGQQLLLSQQQLEKLQGEVQLQKQQLQQAQAQAQQAEQHLQQLQQKSNLQKEHLVTTQQQLQQLQGEAQLQGQQQQQAQEQAEQRLQQASLKLQEKNERLQQLQDETKSLSKRLESAEEQAQLQQSCMMEQLQQAQQDAHLEGQQLQQAQHDAQSMAQQLQQAQQEAAQKEQQVTEECAQRKQQLLQQAQQELAAAQQQLQQTEAEAADLKQQLIEAQADTQDAQLLLESTTGAVAAARQQLQHAAAAKLALQAGLLEALQAGEVSTEQLAIAAEQAQVQQQQHLHQQDASDKRLQQQQLQLTHTEAAAANQADLVQELQQRLTSLEAQHASWQTAQACVDDVKQQLQAAQAAALSYQQQLAAAQAELQAQQLAAKAASQEHQQQLGQLQMQLETTESQLSEAEQQVQGLQTVAHNRLEMLEELQAQLAQAQQQAQDRDHSPMAGLLSPPGLQGQHLVSQHRAIQTLLPDGQPLLPTQVTNISNAHADLTGMAAQLPWLSQQGAWPLAAEGPASSLLAELQHESDELTEQLVQLQQYLKTSTVKYADLNTIEVMDEGLQVLRRLASEVVGVASETVQRVTTAGAAPQSAPTSLAGRAPSRAGTAPPNYASCAGVFEGSIDLQDESEQFTVSPAVSPVLPSYAASRSVALRRLGVELPRLQSWGSEAALPDTPLQRSAAGDTANNLGPLATGGPLSAAAAGSLGGARTAQAGLAGDVLTQPPALGLQALAIRLDHWGSDMSEAACSWLTGDGEAQPDELALTAAASPQGSQSCFASPSGVTAAAVAARVPSRLAAVTVATVSEPGMLSAWGSGMLPVSGPGAAALDQHHQQQHQQQGVGVDTLHHLLHSRVVGSSAGSLEDQLQAALAEVQQLHGERLVLRSQVVQLAELAAQQEDRLAVNDELLSALATGWLEGEDDEGTEEDELH